MLPILIVIAYFAFLYAVSRWSGGGASNDTFFRAGRRAPWPMVAFGMIGASISGVSLISVPGWVASTGMSYLQMCAGFFVGYLVVAFVLLPVYYKLRLTSIYGYLAERFGTRTHKTGASFFILSKLTGAAARLYLACIVLDAFLGHTAWSFPVLVVAVLVMIWLYTRRSGIGAIVRTDALQTACMLIAAAGICWAACSQLNFSIADAWRTIVHSPANENGFSMSTVFVWDAASKQYFWRQFLSGMFITIVMTGLDQDMMQKNLTCSTLRDAQKDMCCYGLAFLPVNALFLGLGVLLYHYCAVSGIAAPERGDDLLPMLVSGGYLGAWVVVPFIIGIASAAFSSADSAITSLTTSTCVDLFGSDDDVAFRRRVHIMVVAAFFLCIMAFRAINSSNAIDAIYTMAGYTYGPLLGLFCFGIYTRKKIHDRWVPAVAIAAPVMCALLDYAAPRLWDYHFGYELLMLNGALTAAGLWLLRRRAD
ncbi:MAG: sodium:solute symporter [Bacteroidales bacterium]|nr:sodium:solute symporter [Bacteroidales bacterium]